MKTKVQCSNCGYFKVKYSSPGLAGAGCLWLLFLILIPFVWPIAVVLLAGGIILAMLDKKTKRGGRLFCKQCKRKWNPDKVEKRLHESDTAKTS